MGRISRRAFLAGAGAAGAGALIGRLPGAQALETVAGTGGIAAPDGGGAGAAAAGNPFPGLVHPDIPKIEHLNPSTPFTPSGFVSPPRWAFPQAYYTPTGALGPKSPEGG